ncbi:MAG: SigE family RNA polymerase sigma factor [Phycicoccus sp.]
MAAARDRSFEEFVRARSTALFHTAYLLVGEHHHAEDVLQAALERAYRTWPRIRRLDHPEAYVRRIVVNLVLDRRRSAARAPDVVAEFDDDIAVPAPDRYALVDTRDALVDGLARLPAAMRAVLVLRYWEELSEAETARALGCSVGTVKSQSSRGLARLRAVIETAPHNGEPDDGPRGHERWVRPHPLSDCGAVDPAGAGRPPRVVRLRPRGRPRMTEGGRP